MAMRTILFELNEVPWRVLDWYVDRHPHSTFARVVSSAATFVTQTEDTGHLHPWVTWPTLHRGVHNERHGIAHLGQDLRGVDEEFPTVWRILAERGATVGVGGSLQSYPAPQSQQGYAFYIPDTYALRPDTIPQRLSRFQDLNLRLTRQNSRNVRSKLSAGDALGLAKEFTLNGGRAATARRIVGQLMDERTDKSRLNRRRGIQSALYFDVFLRQLNTQKPEFCTFFSNHVAAAMHRYWAASFPGDYEAFNLPREWQDTYCGEITWAMDLADDFLRQLVRFCEANPEYRLLIASSMGQAATDAETRDGYYSVVDVARLLACIGIERQDFELAMAMAPDVSVRLQNEEAAQRLNAAIPALQRAFPDIEVELDERGCVHFRLLLPNDPEHPIDPPTIGNRAYTLEELGVGFVADQDKVGTTAYHIPDGIFLSWKPGGQRISQRGERKVVSSVEVAPAILAAHDLQRPGYMSEPSFSL